MPRAAFPLSMARENFYRLGSYRWRVVKFDALDTSFRLMIAIHEPKEQYRAFLGIEVGTDTRFLASYEFHGTHAGWHSLVSCDRIESVPLGIKAGPWQHRLPLPRNRHRRMIFGVTERTAVDKAGRFFRLPAEPREGDSPAGQGELGV